MEAAQRFLEARERFPVGSEPWAKATATAFDMLAKEECAEVAKPEWWSDEGRKALSARVVRAAPNAEPAIDMRAYALSGFSFGSWEAGPRSAVELREAAVVGTSIGLGGAMCPAPQVKAEFASHAEEACSRQVGPQQVSHSACTCTCVLGSSK